MDSLSTIQRASAACNNKKIRYLRSFIGVEGTFLENFPDFFYFSLLYGVPISHRGAYYRPSFQIENETIGFEISLTAGFRKGAKHNTAARMRHTGHATKHDDTLDLFRKFESPLGHIFGFLKISRFQQRDFQESGKMA